MTELLVNWTRTLGFALLILVVANLIAFASGLAMGWMPMDDVPTAQASSERMRLYRRLVIFAAATLLYAWMLRPLPRRVAHAAAAFVLVVTFDVALSWALFGWPEDFPDPYALARGAGAAACGLLLASRLPRRTARATA